MKTFKESHEKLRLAFADFGNAVINNTVIQLLFFTCIFVASMWIGAALFRLLVEIVKAGYNWQL